MAVEEKRAWIAGVVSLVGYAVYVVIVLGRAGEGALAEVRYEWVLLWTVVSGIAVAIVLSIGADIFSAKEDRKKDVRDREIHRFGESVGQAFVVMGAVGAMIMAMAEIGYFWIANAVYLAFVLSALLSSTAKIFAYRRGLHSW